MKNRKLKYSCGLLPLLITGLNAGADTGEFGAQIAINTRHTDNALKVSESPMSERQDRYELGLDGKYENAIVDVNVNYLATAHRFEKDSQEDRTLIVGDSSLRLGKPTQVFDLLLSHSRRTLRNSADELDILDNNDERQIISAVPSLHFNVTAVDTLLISGNYTEVDFRLNEERNATYEGGTVSWQKNLSAVSAMEFNVQHTQIEFDQNPLADYTYQSAMMAYRTTLRNLGYSLAAGYNQSKRDLSEEKNADPIFRAEMTYDTGINQISLYASQMITDSTIGDSNRGEIGIPGPGDVGGREIDQLERKSFELTWQNRMLCDRCDLGATLYLRKDDYFTLAQDSEERGGGVSFGYRFSRASSLSLAWNRREQESREENANFDQDRISLQYRYSFANGVGISIYAEQEESKSELALFDYKELAGGLSLSYRY